MSVMRDFMAAPNSDALGTSKRPSAPQTTLSQPAKAKDGKTAIEATVKGETGYLTVRTANGHYRYGVTLDESKATLFKPGGSADRHAARAAKAGIKIAA